jgi:hypothetical protein
VKDIDLRLKKTTKGFSTLTGDSIYEQHIIDLIKSTFNERPRVTNRGYISEFCRGTASTFKLVSLVSEINNVFDKSFLIRLTDVKLSLNAIKNKYVITIHYRPLDAPSSITPKVFNLSV